MPKPEEWVSKVDPSTGSEFGGVPGLVQPPPHEMDVAETANYMKSVPADEFVDQAWVSTYDVPPTQMVKR
jgi:hypothetical protein